MKIGSRVKCIKNCGHRGDIGTVVGRDKVMMTVVSPSGYMWRVQWDDESPDSLFLSSDLLEAK